MRKLKTEQEQDILKSKAQLIQVVCMLQNLTSQFQAELQL
jgi:hypothetical protein